MSCLIVLLLIQYVSYSESTMEPFIVGGTLGDIKQFPHSVFLDIDCGTEGWICGSSVLVQDILLTAAHCLEDCNRRNIKKSIVALAGAAVLEQVKVSSEFAKFIIHENYDTNTVVNDIGLVFLKKSLPLGSTIKRVIIKNNYNGQKTAEVAGWGVLDAEAQQQSDRLRVVQQKLNSKSSCKQFYRLSPGQICGVGLNKNHLERPAEGDSGSALITDNYQQVGLVSFRDAKFPTVVIYTNVTYYINWIRSKAKSLSCG